MAKGGFKLLDSDMHIIEPPDLWERYIDPVFKSQAPRGWPGPENPSVLEVAGKVMPRIAATPQAHYQTMYARKADRYRRAIEQGTASVVEHEGRITGYATDLAFFAHAVGETNRELMALIGAAPVFGGPGILVPVRNAALFQWCLDHGLRVVQVMTLMTVGLYNEPTGAYLPSVLY